jgi:methionyl-tRNA synthetase
MNEQLKKALAELIVSAEEALPYIQARAIWQDAKQEADRLEHALAVVSVLLFPEKQI